MIKNILIVFIGGGTGSVFRYISSLITHKYFTGIFPLATFLVNITGCLIIGLVTGLYLKNSMSNPDVRLLLVAGFCGGFTTFSAFAQENINLIQTDQLPTAILYTIISVTAGLAFVWLGLSITK
jgi:CrcB protein